jgi:hypothetical protein
VGSVGFSPRNQPNRTQKSRGRNVRYGRASEHVEMETNNVHQSALMAAPNTSDNWTSAWLDAVAFAIGLAAAWWAGWNTGDLVWSLWLSSFVVGYAIIIWMIGQPAVNLAWTAWRERAAVGADPRSLITFWLLILAGASFLLAFFTIHFGGFHYGHSQFLISFFPVDLPGSGRTSHAGMSTYIEIARRYWPFLPSAFLAHRAAFLRKPLLLAPKLSAGSFGDHSSITSIVSEPYRNVIRMHMLIFFFFFAHVARLENFAVYAVVYAVYFFPWRLVRKAEPPATSVQVQ